MLQLESRSSITMAKLAEMFQQLIQKFNILQKDINAIKLKSKWCKHKSCRRHWRRCQSNSRVEHLGVEHTVPGVECQAVLRVEHNHVVLEAGHPFLLLTMKLVTIHGVDHQEMATNHRATPPGWGITKTVPATPCPKFSSHPRSRTTGSHPRRENWD